MRNARRFIGSLVQVEILTLQTMLLEHKVPVKQWPVIETKEGR